MDGDRTRPLEERLRSLSRELTEALGAVLTEVLPETAGSVERLRPVQLTGRLGLNKSLASRVVRALHQEDPLRALMGIPTPQGLHLIERAAQEHGASEESQQRLQLAAESYGTALGEFSGGRTDLEATLVGWIPEERERAERDARRSVFRGMTTLAGTRTGVVYNALYLLPSAAESGWVDSVTVAVRQDVRRLRVGERIVVMSLRADPAAPGAPAESQPRGLRTALDGSDIGGDPRQLLLPDLCSHPVPELELESACAGTPPGPEHGSLVVRIAKDALDVNEFATLGFGWRTTGHFDRMAQGGDEFANMSFMLAKPAEALVVDLFVHRDLQLPSPPFVTLTHERSLAQVSRSRPPSDDAPERSEAPPLIDLDRHPSGLSSPDVRLCKAIAENACREAGCQLDEFRKFRTRLEFPTATEALTLWWPRGSN